MFEGTNYPTINVVLPNILYCVNELLRIADGGLAIRLDSKEVAPSICTKLLCNVVQEELKKVEIIDLWLVGC